MTRIETVFLFDLDGTLVDSVYQHVLSWQDALDAGGIPLSVWRIHRRIGMSGGLFTNMLLRETGIEASPELLERLRRGHAAAYKRRADKVRPLPGARELLTTLTANGIPWAIATSGRMETAGRSIESARRRHDKRAGGDARPGEIRQTRPRPVPRRRASARRADRAFGGRRRRIWDMLAARRCRALGVGLLSGGYGEDELISGGAARVYEDPADLLKHLDEVGGRR